MNRLGRFGKICSYLYNSCPPTLSMGKKIEARSCIKITNQKRKLFSFSLFIRYYRIKLETISVKNVASCWISIEENVKLNRGRFFFFEKEKIIFRINDFTIMPYSVWKLGESVEKKKGSS